MSTRTPSDHSHCHVERPNVAGIRPGWGHPTRRNENHLATLSNVACIVLRANPAGSSVEEMLRIIANWQAVGRFLLSFDQILAGVNHIQTKNGRVCFPNSMKFEPASFNFEYISAESGPTRPKSDQTRPNCGQIWSNSADLVRCWPTLGPIRPTLADLDQIRATLGPFFQDVVPICPMSANFDRFRPDVGRVGPALVEFI